MRIAILDPAAGISGDMTLGALLSLGVPSAWLEGLPGRLGLAGVGVSVRDVVRCGVRCTQVEFTIPEQPHGRHVGELVRLVERAPVSEWVRERAVRAFRLVGEAEGRVHGVAPEQVHLHEVGAVDAVLDIVGAIEGFEQLGVDAIYTWPVAVGRGWIEAAHGALPVPAPATAILLEGLELAGGGGGGGPVEGEGTTPTGAGLVRVLAAGAPPRRWRPVQSAGGAVGGGAAESRAFPQRFARATGGTSGRSRSGDARRHRSGRHEPRVCGTVAAGAGRGRGPGCAELAGADEEGSFRVSGGGGGPRGAG